MGLVADLKQLRLFLKVRLKLKEDSRMRGTLSAGYALASCVVVAVVAKATLACPDLTSKFVPALVAGVLGGAALYARRPETAPKVKAAGAGTATFAAIALVWDEVRKALAEVCGASFNEQLPTMLAAGAMVGLGLYLQSHKGGDDDKVSPGWKPPAAAVVVLLGLLSASCGSLAQVRVGGEPKPAGPDQKVVEVLVCRGEDEKAEVYISDRGGTRAEITERVERARADTAGRPGCACRETTCVGLKPAN